MISIITPSHNTRYLEQVYQYLSKQTIKNWEWIILLNGDGDLNLHYTITSDIRVRNYRSMLNTTNIGALKKEACSHASGDIILELDHDDFLLENALEECEKAFEDPEVVFAFSDALPIRPDKTVVEYRKDFGWKYEPTLFNNETFLHPVTPEAIPQNISKIWFAPDHFRAWRKSTYDLIGGHNEEMPVADDHDLICRLYLQGKFVKIDKCLYIYNVHGENTSLQKSQDIQTLMMNNYRKYIEPMMMKWSNENSLLCIDLCGAIDTPPGYLSVDRHNADFNMDLNHHWRLLANNSVGLIRANDAIEHMKDPIHTMNEAYRVLAHGGMFLIDVPSTDGKGAFCDPTHVSFWNDRSFRYYTEAAMRRYLEPECKCSFQISLLENIMKYDNLPYVRAHLIAVKEGSRIMGQYLF